MGARPESQAFPGWGLPKEVKWGLQPNPGALLQVSFPCPGLRGSNWALCVTIIQKKLRSPGVPRLGVPNIDLSAVPEPKVLCSQLVNLLLLVLTNSHGWAGEPAATGAAGSCGVAPCRIPCSPGDDPVTKKSQGSQAGMHSSSPGSIWTLFPRVGLRLGYYMPSSSPGILGFIPSFP